MKYLIIGFFTLAAFALIIFAAIFIFSYLIEKEHRYTPDHNAFKEDQRQYYDDWTGLN